MTVPHVRERIRRLREEIERHNYQYYVLDRPLVSDADKAVLTAYGAYGEKQNYGRTFIGVIRSTFVIDPAGRIEKALYNVKATGHVAKLRRDLGL